MADIKLTKAQEEALRFICQSEEPVKLSSRSRVYKALIEKGFLEIYRIPVQGVPACYSTVIAYVRLTDFANWYGEWK